jgi:anti-anti-sigma regulatory factor
MTAGSQDPAQAPRPLAIEGELSIYRAAELRQWLDEQLPLDAELCIDLSGVTEIDTAGAQLLLAGQRLARERRCKLHYRDPSPCVQSLVALFDLGAQLPGLGPASESSGVVVESQT